MVWLIQLAALPFTMRVVVVVAAIRVLVLLAQEATAAAGQEVLTPTMATQAQQIQVAALVAAGELLPAVQQLALLVAQA